jgi:hypothetical protein
MAVTFETNDAAYVASTAGAIYTNASGETSYLKSITLHNTNTTSENVKIYIVPDSSGSVGTAGVSNRIYNVTLATNETLQIEFPGPGKVLKGTNDTVQAVTDTASKVTYWATVRIDT